MLVSDPEADIESGKRKSIFSTRWQVECLSALQDAPGLKDKTTDSGGSRLTQMSHPADLQVSVRW